jgi:hypothetical protein
VTYNDTTKTCSRSCSNRLAYLNGRRKDWGFKKGLFKHWDEVFSADIAQQKKSDFRVRMGNAIRSADMTNQKEKASATFRKMNTLRKGKNLEEIFGESKAASIREKLSNSRKGSLNPAYGKIYKYSGRSVKGYYKGKFFRSLLELSFMIHLENQNISLDSVRYECFSIPWIDDKGSSRSYKIDFFIPEENTVVEVKQSFALSDRENILKWKAASDFLSLSGIQFKVVTETDIQKIKFIDAQSNPDVSLDERSFKSFRRKSGN